MRVAMVSDFFFPNGGGVENHIFAVASCLARRGHRVCVVTHAYGDRTGVRWVEPGIKVFYLPLIAVYNQSTLPTAVGSFFLLRSVLLRERIEVVHGHSAFSSLANEAAGVAATFGIPYVFTDHSLFGFSDASAALTNKLLRYNLLFASRVICVSHTGRENTVLRSGLPPERVSVIPNAIDPCSFRPDPAKGAAPGANGRVTVVVVMRLVYRKGVDLLTRVIPAVCARHPEVDFVVGGDGPKRVDIEEVRDRHALQGRVRMLGAVPHARVRDVMCEGHIFLNASLTEAFCIAIVEAASCGMVVVSTAVGGVPEVLPSDMIRLAPPTASALVDAVSAALPDAAKLTAASRQRQHERVASMYDWRVVAERTERVYQSCAEDTLPGVHERLCRTLTVGPIAGLILSCAVVLLEMCNCVAAWLAPIDAARLGADARWVRATPAPQRQRRRSARTRLPTRKSDLDDALSR